MSAELAMPTEEYSDADESLMCPGTDDDANDEELTERTPLASTALDAQQAADGQQGNKPLVPSNGAVQQWTGGATGHAASSPNLTAAHEAAGHPATDMMTGLAAAATGVQQEAASSSQHTANAVSSMQQPGSASGQPAHAPVHVTLVPCVHASQQSGPGAGPEAAAVHSSVRSLQPPSLPVASLSPQTSSCSGPAESSAGSDRVEGMPTAGVLTLGNMTPQEHQREFPGSIGPDKRQSSTSTVQPKPNSAGQHGPGAGQHGNTAAQHSPTAPHRSTTAVGSEAAAAAASGSAAPTAAWRTAHEQPFSAAGAGSGKGTVRQIAPLDRSQDASQPVKATGAAPVLPRRVTRLRHLSPKDILQLALQEKPETRAQPRRRQQSSTPKDPSVGAKLAAEMQERLRREQEEKRQAAMRGLQQQSDFPTTFPDTFHPLCHCRLAAAAMPSKPPGSPRSPQEGDAACLQDSATMPGHKWDFTCSKPDPAVKGNDKVVVYECSKGCQHVYHFQCYKAGLKDRLAAEYSALRGKAAAKDKHKVPDILPCVNQGCEGRIIGLGICAPVLDHHDASQPLDPRQRQKSHWEVSKPDWEAEQRKLKAAAAQQTGAAAGGNNEVSPGDVYDYSAWASAEYDDEDEEGDEQAVEPEIDEKAHSQPSSAPKTNVDLTKVTFKELRHSSDDEVAAAAPSKAKHKNKRVKSAKVDRTMRLDHLMTTHSYEPPAESDDETDVAAESYDRAWGTVAPVQSIAWEKRSGHAQAAQYVDPGEFPTLGAEVPLGPKDAVYFDAELSAIHLLKQDVFKNTVMESCFVLLEVLDVAGLQRKGVTMGFGEEYVEQWLQDSIWSRCGVSPSRMRVFPKHNAAAVELRSEDDAQKVRGYMEQHKEVDTSCNLHTAFLLLFPSEHVVQQLEQHVPLDELVEQDRCAREQAALDEAVRNGVFNIQEADDEQPLNHQTTKSGNLQVHGVTTGQPAGCRLSPYAPEFSPGTSTTSQGGVVDHSSAPQLADGQVFDSYGNGTSGGPGASRRGPSGPGSNPLSAAAQEFRPGSRTSQHSIPGSNAAAPAGNMQHGTATSSLTAALQQQTAQEASAVSWMEDAASTYWQGFTETQLLQTNTETLPGYQGMQQVGMPLQYLYDGAVGTCGTHTLLMLFNIDTWEIVGLWGGSGQRYAGGQDVFCFYSLGSFEAIPHEQYRRYKNTDGSSFTQHLPDQLPALLSTDEQLPPVPVLVSQPSSASALADPFNSLPKAQSPRQQQPQQGTDWQQSRSITYSETKSAAIVHTSPSGYGQVQQSSPRNSSWQQQQPEAVGATAVQSQRTQTTVPVQQQQQEAERDPQYLRQEAALLKFNQMKEDEELARQLAREWEEEEAREAAQRRQHQEEREHREAQERAAATVKPVLPPPPAAATLTTHPSLPVVGTTAAAPQVVTVSGLQVHAAASYGPTASYASTHPGQPYAHVPATQPATTSTPGQPYAHVPAIRPATTLALQYQAGAAGLVPGRLPATGPPAYPPPPSVGVLVPPQRPPAYLAARSSAASTNSTSLSATKPAAQQYQPAAIIAAAASAAALRVAAAPHAPQPSQTVTTACPATHAPPAAAAVGAAGPRPVYQPSITPPTYKPMGPSTASGGAGTAGPPQYTQAKGQAKTAPPAYAPPPAPTAPGPPSYSPVVTPSAAGAPGPPIYRPSAAQVGAGLPAHNPATPSAGTGPPAYTPIGPPTAAGPTKAPAYQPVGPPAAGGGGSAGPLTYRPSIVGADAPSYPAASRPPLYRPVGPPAASGLGPTGPPLYSPVAAPPATEAPT